jgi:hypothetical protein
MRKRQNRLDLRLARPTSKLARGEQTNATGKWGHAR